MVEIAESPRDLHPWPISDESDDLETPLQVWQRLFGNSQLEAGNSTSSSTVKECKDAVTIRKNGVKRKCRRRVSSRESQSLSTSDEEESIIGQKLRPKAKSKPRSNQTKIGCKSPQNQPSSDEFLVIEDDPSPPRKKGVQTRSTTRRQRGQLARCKPSRKQRKTRKKPLEFIGDDKKAVDPTSEFQTTASDTYVDEKLNDSQATILLDTPELVDSLEVSKREDVKMNHPQTSALTSTEQEVHPVRSDEIITRVEESDPENLLGAKKKASKVIISDDSSTDIDKNDGISTDIHLPHSSVKNPPHPSPEVETTDLDEIFFKPHASTKKPPPTKAHKKLASNYSVFVFSVGIARH